MLTLLALCCVALSHTVQGDGRSGDGRLSDERSGDEKRYWTTALPSCRYYNCGYDMGSCSCSSSCESRGNCCPDYYNYCHPTTTAPPHWPTTALPSCHYWNCGYDMGSCSCSSSCEYRGNCCPDYYNYCRPTTTAPPHWPTTDQPSCRYNCGRNMGSCSCSSSCENNRNCCHDYYYYCHSTTWGTTTTATTTDSITHWTHSSSCLYNCGYHMGSCSCQSSCENRGNCCNDYHYYCHSTTAEPTTADQPSCRYNCGKNMGSCSCSSSCEYRGNCCPDYYNYCHSTTTSPPHWQTTDQPSCRYNCGSNMGSCSCSSSCEYRGNCCRDYYNYCWSTTHSPVTDQPSCRYNCGWNMGSCSCSSSCEYNRNCCHDYYSYCYSSTESPFPQTTGLPSCRYNCGRNMGSCSCSSSCEYNRNCCPDYYSYCSYTTEWPVTGTPCGGSLFGSGNFTSPNHPNHYHNNAYCVWHLRAVSNQRVFLTFSYLELENCCGCDYISVYDGPSLGSPLLGKLCFSNLTASFHSSSNHMTVVFRSDYSVIARGFKANFLSSLPTSSGRVSCSSENMTIVIERSYLSSLGYDPHSLYLNNMHCRPQVTRYQVVFSYPIDNCGNIRKVYNGTDMYINSLRAYSNDSNGEITYKGHFKLDVMCRMHQDSYSHIMYIVDTNENSTILGTGRYNTSMAFYTSRSFYYKVTEFPYQVTLNQNLYVQVDLERHAGSRIIFLDTCVASPSPTDFQTRTHYLIRNGCPVDQTVEILLSGSVARFTFRAFQFLRATESVYIQCKVLVCQSNDTNSRCRRGCMRRKARDLTSEQESKTLVLGPIQLRGPEKKSKGLWSRRRPNFKLH